MAIAEITPQELVDVLTHDPHPALIDVRTPVQFREVHLAGARNIPFEELSPEKVPMEADAGGEEQEVDGVLAHVLGKGAVVAHSGLDVEGIGQLLDQLGRGVDYRDVGILARQVAGDVRSDHTCTTNDHAHASGPTRI